MKNKTLRMEGKEYLGYKKVLVKSSDESVIEKLIQSKRQRARRLGPRCNSAYCQKASALNCMEVDEAVRTEEFRKFWRMDWELKKLRICSLVDLVQVKRRTTGQDSRRSVTCMYYLPNGNEKVRVCKTTFLSTFDITETQVRFWIRKKKSPGLVNQQSLPLISNSPNSPLENSS